MLFATIELAGFITIIFLNFAQDKSYMSKLIEVTPDIKIPEAKGQNQHGSARFLTEKEKDEYFDVMTINYKDNLIKLLEAKADEELHEVAQVLYNEIQNDNFEWSANTGKPTEKLKRLFRKSKNDDRLMRLVEKCKGDEKPLLIKSKPIVLDSEYVTKAGTVLGLTKTKSGEKILCLDTDTHTIVIGATRSGKTRTVVLQTLGLLGLAGESIIISDPKGELYKYTKPFLECLGYDVYALDFKSPFKSDRYNFLQPVIDAIDENDIDLAQKCAMEIANLLVSESTNTEPIWKNGELCVMAASILIIVYDNRNAKHRKYQNLTNVFHFIKEMCKSINDDIPLVQYIEDMDKNHPAKSMISVQDVAPFRTKASFNISALMTLNLFALNEIHQMTDQSDFDLKKIGDKKTAIFIILPDYTKSYYTLASLFVSQVYTDLIKVADERGMRLKRRVNIVADEFGNFAEIKDFDTKLTVGGGRGLRFTLILQDYAQLKNVYNDNGANIIKGNCETMIYLQSDDQDTIESISKKLGDYTVSTYSLSSSHQQFVSSSNSQSVNLTGRNLLTPSEIQLIKRPYSLVTSRTHPTVVKCPDISEWEFNKLFGLGDKEHNRAVTVARDKMRFEREKNHIMDLWEIWEIYQEALKMKNQGA